MEKRQAVAPILDSNEGTVSFDAGAWLGGATWSTVKVAAVPTVIIRLFLAVVIILPDVAQAELGGSLASVKTDAGRMSAPLVSESMGGYTRHAMTRPNGGAVHELTNANGQVFAVTWSGPGKPDLRSLLGSRFAAIQPTNNGVGRSLHALRRPMQVNQTDLQIQTAGHMGWFRGVAFIPSLAPAGFSISELSQQP